MSAGQPAAPRARETDVRLRPVRDDDLPVFFEHMQDAMSQRMAAFIPERPGDREAFEAHWRKNLANATVVIRTVEVGGRPAGYAASFMRADQREVSYWIDRALWNRGIATAALGLLLAEVPARPLYARAASANAASIRVLEKHGFTRCAEGAYFSHSYGREVSEVVMVLGA